MLDFIEVYDGAMKSTECKTIIDFMEKEELKPGVLGDSELDIKKKDSQDMSLNFNMENNIDLIILDILEKYRYQYSEKHTMMKQISLWNVSAGYNYQKYDPGQGYHVVHCENQGQDSVKRIAAWMIYLNTVTEGGGTYFPNYDRTLDAVEGRLAIWPAFWTHPHRGVVSHTQTKHIVTGWFQYVVDLAGKFNPIIQKFSHTSNA